MIFTLQRDGQTEDIEVAVRRLLISGFTARDRAVVMAHLDEVRHLGVQLPDRLPALYPSVVSRLTHAAVIQAPTSETSGEAEIVFIQDGDRLLLALGSDHTERSSEGVALVPSKTVCDKPISRAVWDSADVLDHIEELELVCEIRQDDEWREYQNGLVSHFMPLEELLADTEGRAGWRDGDVLMCGTLPTVGGGLIYADSYRMVLRDPVLGRELALDYAVEVIDVDLDREVADVQA